MYLFARTYKYAAERQKNVDNDMLFARYSYLCSVDKVDLSVKAFGFISIIKF